MKNAWAGVAVILMVAGCGKDENKAADAKIHSKGEEAMAGKVAHKLVSVERMEVIPKAMAIGQWKESAEDQPAPEGKVWVLLKGQVVNKTGSDDRVNTTALKIVDENNKEYDMSTDTVWFCDPPISVAIKDGATLSWEAFFEVPKASKKLYFVGTDLKYSPDAKAKFNVD